MLLTEKCGNVAVDLSVYHDKSYYSFLWTLVFYGVVKMVAQKSWLTSDERLGQYSCLRTSESEIY
jgi:hypothetical protein